MQNQEKSEVRFDPAVNFYEKLYISCAITFSGSQITIKTILKKLWTW